MKVSVILLAIAAALLVAGICLDGWLGFALCGAANVCSFTALVRQIRRGAPHRSEADKGGQKR